MRWPHDFALALDRLPALSSSDYGLDCVRGVRGYTWLGDRVGDVVHGGDTDVVCHVCTLCWGHLLDGGRRGR